MSLMLRFKCWRNKVCYECGQIKSQDSMGKRYCKGCLYDLRDSLREQVGVKNKMLVASKTTGVDKDTYEALWDLILEIRGALQVPEGQDIIPYIKHLMSTYQQNLTLLEGSAIVMQSIDDDLDESDTPDGD